MPLENMTANFVPPIYRNMGSITGLPLNWRDEVTGELPAAINAYLDNRIDGKPITDRQIALVRSYMVHYVHAPCWNHMNQDEEFGRDLAKLRAESARLKSPDDIGRWIRRCLDVGMDPL